VYQGNEEFVNLILSKGADVNCITGQGYTVLHMVGSGSGARRYIYCLQAVINDHVSLVPVLLKAGADVNLADEESLTPLHMAARSGPSPSPPCQGRPGGGGPDACQGRR
jgi:ankyrin repeat protein